jgi:hypothetical protein
MTATRNLTLAISAAALLAGAASAQGYYDTPYRARADAAAPSSYYYDYRGQPLAPRYGPTEQQGYAPAPLPIETPADLSVPPPPAYQPVRTSDTAPAYAPMPLAGGPSRDPAPAQPYSPNSRAYNTGATVADIAMQPAKDIGVKQTAIPPVLAAAEASPYAMSDASNCAQMAQALTELDAALGPDYTVERLPAENKKAKIAEAGGRAVVNSIIPFRGIVREVTGAAAADRAMAAAVDAGLARRGFLRGLQTAQGCEPGAQASLSR